MYHNLAASIDHQVCHEGKEDRRSDVIRCLRSALSLPFINRSKKSDVIKCQLLLGKSLLLSGDEADAIEIYKKILEDEPNHAEAKKILDIFDI